MKDFLSLKIIDKFQLIFKIMKIDYPTMRKIIQIKLIMDSRRVPTVFRNTRNNQYNYNKNYFLSSLWINLIFGVILISLMFIPKSDLMIQMTIILTILMFLLISTVMSDFSNVILDTRDKNIILTKPVEPKTLSMAKTIHVSIYMFYITLALAGPSLLVSLFMYGFLFFLLFLGELIFIDLFIVVITTLLYLLILYFYSGEKLKDMINYIQIMTSITIAISYQFINQVAFINGKYTFHAWNFLFPPFWFAGIFEFLINQNLEYYSIILSILSLVVPVLSFMIYLSFIPSFEVNLEKLNAVVNEKKRIKKPYGLFTKFFLKTREESIFYRFASNMIRQEREFKLKVYPSLGFAIIFPLIFIFRFLMSESFSDIRNNPFYILNIYFSAFFIPLALGMLQYSSHYKGAWIYRVTPFKDDRYAFRGAVKAFIVHLFLPLYLFQSLIFLLIFNLKIIPDLIVVFLAIMGIFVIYFMLIVKHLPFSESIDNMNRNQAGTTFLYMFIILFFVLIHLAVLIFPYVKYVYIVILIIFDILLWKTGFNKKTLL